MAASKKGPRRRKPSAPRQAAERRQGGPEQAAATSSAPQAAHAPPGTAAVQPAGKKVSGAGENAQKPNWKRRALTSGWTWLGTVAAGVASAVLAAVFLSPSSSSPPPAAPRTAAGGPPVTALVDFSGTGPCNSPRTVVAAPGPVGMRVSGSYPGSPASGSWLNVLVQGDGGAPVTVEAVTAKILSRQQQKPGAVLYSYCQGSSPSHTYVRLDLQEPDPVADGVPEPDPTGPAAVVPLPIEVTSDSPAQFYVKAVSGSTTVRWSLQVHWERGSESGTVTAGVSGQQGAAGARDTAITTVGTDGDRVLCPDGAGDTWALSKASAC